MYLNPDIHALHLTNAFTRLTIFIFISFICLFNYYYYYYFFKLGYFIIIACFGKGKASNNYVSIFFKRMVFCMDNNYESRSSKEAETLFFNWNWNRWGKWEGQGPMGSANRIDEARRIAVLKKIGFGCFILLTYGGRFLAATLSYRRGGRVKRSFYSYNLMDLTHNSHHKVNPFIIKLLKCPLGVLLQH